MKRRTFIKSSSLTAFSVAAFGTIHCNGNTYTGNNPTTTDILGPFYRPGAPMRSNLVTAGSKGTPMELVGTIFQTDGQTPQADVLIEAWQCDENQHYDNTSDEYFYRGATKTGKDGKYAFQTIIPVPYEAGPGSWRPAHIHLRVSSPTHQDLITQIYFQGDPHLDDDTSSSSPTAANRILKISESAGKKKVTFDVIMAQSIPLDDSVYSKISGLYDLDKGMVEFYREDDLLMMKRNGQISEGLVYKGNNSFEGALGWRKVKFELLPEGGTKATISQGSNTLEGTKVLKYG
jgi:protocatechuate 3,4-dioxygenase beta subunit